MHMEENERQYFASLSAYHPEASPFEVTRALMVPPDEVALAGLPRLTLRRDGIVDDAPAAWPHSMWTISTRERVDESALQPHVEWLLDIARRRATAIARLGQSGWTLRVFCFASGGQSPPPVAPALVREFGQLGVVFEVDHYPDYGWEQDFDAAESRLHQRVQILLSSESPDLSALVLLGQRIASRGVGLPHPAAERIAPAELRDLVLERGASFGAAALLPLMSPTSRLSIDDVFGPHGDACLFVVLASGGGDKDWLERCRQLLTQRIRSASRSQMLRVAEMSGELGDIRLRMTLLAAIPALRSLHSVDLLCAIGRASE